MFPTSHRVTRTILTIACFSAALIHGPARAEDPPPAPAPAPEPAPVPALEETIEVKGKKVAVPARQSDETVFTGSRVTKEGVEAQGSKATMSVYRAINILSGVQVEGAESNGLAAEQSSVRIRGVRASLGALTVEGIPNYGGNPIGPRDYLFDMENMDSVSLYKGIIPADIGTGVGCRGGVVLLSPRWPGIEGGAALSQTAGADSFSRTFLRLDSGSFTSAGTRVAGSVSYSTSDKWRGPGDLGPRRNANLMFVQPAGEKVDISLWLNRNELDQNLFRALSFAQTRDLAANYEFDYNAALTGTAAQDIYYFDYNRGEYENDDVFAVIAYRPSERTTMTVKPYWSREDTVIFQGTTGGGGRVQQRNRDIERLGVLAELRLLIGEIQTAIGYHYEVNALEVFTRNFAITPDGLQNRGLGVFASNNSDAYTNAPYAKVAGRAGRFNWQAGLKYFNFEQGASDGYTAGPAPDYAPVRAPDLDRETETYDVWIPTLGFSYDATRRVQLFAGYGKSYIRPYSYLPLAATYNNNRAAFQAIGVTFADLFAGYDMEESTTIDFGARVRLPRLEIMPTIYYAEHEKLLTTISDSRVIVNGRPLSYGQNVGEASGFGADVQINVFPSESLTIFVNPTYTELTYDEDLSFQGNTLATKDLQIVDTPEWSGRAGLIYTWRNLEVTPLLRYVGSRYGDATHRERIDSYVVADLTAAYTFRKLWHDAQLRLSAEVANLLGEEYVGVINASDDTRAGAASYFPGAPRQVIVRLGLAL